MHVYVNRFHNNDVRKFYKYETSQKIANGRDFKQSINIFLFSMYIELQHEPPAHYTERPVYRSLSDSGSAPARYLSSF